MISCYNLLHIFQMYNLVSMYITGHVLIMFNLTDVAWLEMSGTDGSQTQADYCQKTLRPLFFHIWSERKRLYCQIVVISTFIIKIY